MRMGSQLDFPSPPSPQPQLVRILVINPNTTTAVTAGCKPAIAQLALPNTQITYWTAPTGPAIITSDAQIKDSAFQCLSHLMPVISQYDGFLVAGYADHLLVPLLQTHVPRTKTVCGIFQTSIATALQLLTPGEKFGIVTTGVQYEEMLKDGVARVLGATGGQCGLLSGVVATGLTYEETVAEERAVAKGKMMEATRRLLRDSDVGVICMGGVILVGMEPWVREACVEVLGEERGMAVRIVEQMRAGVAMLDGLCRIGF